MVEEKEDEVKIIKQIFLIIEENIPDDCRELVIRKLRDKLLRDIKELGVKETIRKWLAEDSEEDGEVTLVY
ncbi:hypothetical protein V6M85_04155 [Sulfolobus tengchongensis]|uniref:Uncharacterized protein n=1 Tax=Sulfolobus tengchongensis TaxID=207809 RepID=A0AAX4L4Z3_9CREN